MLVRRFLRTLKIPNDYYTLQRGVDSHKGGRRYDVQISLVWQGKEKQQEYMVLALRVDNEENVHIESDRRPYIEELLCNPRVSTLPSRSAEYDEDEAREVFMDYISTLRDMSPDWIREINRGSEEDIRHGFDAWVVIVNKRGKTCKAPIKVCVSRSHKASYFRRRRPAEIQRTIAVLIKPGMEKVETIRAFYQVLTNKRNNGTY